MEHPAKTKLYEANDFRDLTELLRQIHTGETALPDFQRDFVWDPPMTQELIVTIAHYHAAGSVWRIRNTQRVFAWRAFQGAPGLQGCQPTFLVLDGQQRFTALYRVFYGVGEHRYYVDLRRLLNDADFEDCLFYLRANTQKAQGYESFDVQARELVLPLIVLKGGMGAFSRWSRQVVRLWPRDGERDRLEDALSEVEERWIRAIDTYQFPVVTLSESAGIEAVCRMFVKLNGTGVKLGPFELLTAHFWPQDIRLRRLWETARADYPIIAEFAIDPYYILQIISLVARNTPFCKLSDVLNLEASTITVWWNRAVDGLARGLEILRDDCGVITPRWLPYNSIVIPLAAILAKLTRPGSPEAGVIRQKLVRWFWCSVFGQTYEQGSNTQAARDVAEILDWCAGGPPPETVRHFRFDPCVLQEATAHQRALYRGAMCLILRRGPRDFHNGAKLTGDLIVQDRIDDHHVFPKMYLDRHGVAARLRDCVLNRTLIDRITNKALHTRAPADYLAQIQTILGAEKLQELLQSHLLPGEPDSPLWHNDFEGLVAWRQKRLWQDIQWVTGLTDATPMTDVSVGLPRIRMHANATAAPSCDGIDSVSTCADAAPRLGEYLTRQSDRTQRLFQTLDHGIHALASDITAKVTRGRRSAGGVSYSAPERCFLCADFLRTADGLTLSVFTGGQPWDGVNPSASSPWGSFLVRSDADLTRALAIAKAAYQMIKRAMRGPYPTGHSNRRLAATEGKAPLLRSRIPGA